jgi:hypothetical protein
MPRELIKDGYYFGIVTDHGYGPADGEDGTPFLAVQFDLETMDTHQPAGKITAYLYLSDKAIEQTAKKLRAIGYTGTEGGELADGTKLKGLRCQVQVTQEAYNGEVRNKVGWINPENSVPGVGKGEASAKANANRLSTLLKTVPVKDTKLDDIPF